MSAARKLAQSFESDQVLRENSYSGVALFAIFQEQNKIFTLLEHESNVTSALDQFTEMLSQEDPSILVLKYLCPRGVENEVKARLSKLGSKLAGKGIGENEVVDFIVNPARGKVLVKFKKGHNSADGSSAAIKKSDHKVTPSPQLGPMKLLIVDDSKTIRLLIKNAMTPFKDKVEVVADTGKPSEVADLIDKHKPDLMTLDINMDEMNGDVLLQKIFPKHYVPTLVLSSLGLTEGRRVINALEAGAVDYLQKPDNSEMQNFGKDLLSKFDQIKGTKAKKSEEKVSRQVSADFEETDIWAIGASTGGTEAIKSVIERWPNRIPASVIAIHMPPYFSKAFADRLDSLSPFKVKEAEDNETLEPNKVLVAPGGFHMAIKKRKDGKLYVKLTESVVPSEHKPSVDQLFNSLVALDKHKITACILTGMGKDGASGLLNLKRKGFWTIGQDEETCVVYGMPKAAFNMGATCEVLPLNKIAESFVKKR